MNCFIILIFAMLTRYLQVANLDATSNQNWCY